MPATPRQVRNEANALRREGSIDVMDLPVSLAAGPDPYLLLAVGGDLAGSTVVNSIHGQTFTAGVAEALSRSVDHGVEIRSLLLRRTDLLSIANALRRVDLSSIDAVVILLDAGTLGDPGATARLLDSAWRLVLPGTAITLVVPPAPQDDMRSLRQRIDQIKRSTSPLNRVVLLSPRSRSTKPPLRDAAWASTIAAELAKGLLDPVCTWRRGWRTAGVRSPGGT